MNKFILRIALFLGLLVGFTSPALAYDEDYVTLDLTVKPSQYKGGHGTVAISAENAETPTHGGWATTQSIRMKSTKRNQNNTLRIYAKPEAGYSFKYWADMDSKTTLPDKASTDKEALYNAFWKDRIFRQLVSATGTVESDYKYSDFHFYVYETFLLPHHPSHTLFAVFEPATYTIQFDPGVGATVSPASKTVMFQDPYGALPTPTKVGYTFAGWFNSNDEQVFPTTIKGAGDNPETLTAHWTENTYTIHFVDLEANDGAGHLLHTNIPNAAYSLATGQMPNLATSYQFSWDTENKYFAGYYTQPNGLGIRVYKGVVDGSTLAKGDAFTPTGDTTLYAHYTHIHHNMYWDYTYYDFGRDYHNLRQDDVTNRIKNARLTFKNGDGNKIKSVILYADDVTNKTTELTADFATHTTSRANIKLSVSNTPTTDGATVSSSAGAHNVYFTEDDLAAFRSYTFEPLKNAATPEVPIEWVAVTEKDKHETILTFMGASDPAHNYSQKWSVTLSGLLINPDVIYVMPLFATKENPNTWAGISQLDNTLGVPCAKENDQVIDPETGARQATYNGSFLVWKGYNNAIGLVGFTLGGQTYYMNTEHSGLFSPFYNSAIYTSEGTGIIADPGANNEDVSGVETVIQMTVPASQIPVIRFLPEGGVLSSTTPSYFVSAYNANVDLSGYSATRAGYTLSGWLDEETGATIATDAQITANRAHTLHAQWQGRPYTVTLDPNSGVVGSITEVTANYMVDMPTLANANLPTRAGYNFQGFWDINDVKYYNADGTSAHAYDKMEASTLYAGWTPKTYTVSLNHNDGASITETVVATYGEALQTVKRPVWIGHVFMGYFDDPDEGEGTMYISAAGHGTQAWDKTTSGVVLYAHWGISTDKYTIWYGKGDFDKSTWNSLEFGYAAEDVNHHVWETSHIEITEDFKIDTDDPNEMHYFVVEGDRTTEVTAADKARKMVMGNMGVAPCNEADGTCQRKVHQLILPEDGEEYKDRAEVFGHFHIWSDMGAETNFSCHLVRDFVITYYSNFPLGLSERTFAQVVEFETGQTIIKDNPFFLGHFPDGLLTFNGWNTQADGLGTSYAANDPFVFDPERNINIKLYAQWTVDQGQLSHLVHHQKGAYNEFVNVNGHDYQQVHTYERYIIMKPGETQRLYRPDWTSYRNYVRWYNFETDAACPNLTYTGTFNAERTFENAQGQFFIGQKADGTVTFTAPTGDHNFDTKHYANGITVACDQSAYSDGSFESFGFQHSYLFWFIYDHNRDRAAHPGPFTLEELNALPENSTKTVYIAQPLNGGFFMSWTNTFNGSTMSSANLDQFNARSFSQDIYHFILTKKEDGGFTIERANARGQYFMLNSDMSYTFRAPETNEEATVWYFDVRGEATNETNLGTLDKSASNHTLLRLHTAGNKYFHVKPAGWGNVVGSYAVSIPSGQSDVQNTEPTLSQRLLFHIIPASRVADILSDEQAWSDPAAMVNLEHLPWMIRKQNGMSGKNKAFTKITYNTLASSLPSTEGQEITVQIIWPEIKNNGGYALTNHPELDNKYTSQGYYGWVRDWVRSVSDGSYTTGDNWECTFLKIRKSATGGYYYIIADYPSYNDKALYLTLSDDGAKATWEETPNGDNSLFEIRRPEMTLRLGSHLASTDNNGYLMTIKSKSGHYLTSEGNYLTPGGIDYSTSMSKDDLESAKFLANQNILVPTGQTFSIGPTLQWKENNQFDYSAHTYYYRDGSELKPCTAGQGGNGTWQWRKDGVPFTPSAVHVGRFAEMTKEEHPGKHIYTLQYIPNSLSSGQQHTFNVVRFNVEFADKALIGPSSELGYTAVENAEEVAREDFNFIDDAERFGTHSRVIRHGTDDVRFYKIPLTAPEAAYGFYNGGDNHYGGGGQRKFPFWGEYGLVSTSAKSWGVDQSLAQHDESVTLDGSNAETGYCIYIDGSMIPGQVFELDVDDLSLCSNSKMYCSAWVASVTEEPYTKPNFDFEVFAYNTDTKEEAVVTTYTTGELTVRNKWQHVLFPVVYHGEVGHVSNSNLQFRVRVINKGKDAHGNDFMIDDIAFYVKHAPFTAIQATTSACLEAGASEVMPLYLRVDYELLVADEGESHSYYYGWVDDKGNAVANADGYFWETDASTDHTTYGKINLSADLTDKPVYRSFREFDNDMSYQSEHAVGGLKAQRAYVYELGKDGRERPFLYIVQPLAVQANRTYRVVMSNHEADVTSHTANQCALTADLDIIAGARIRVDGEVFTHETDICGNHTYTLDVEMLYVMQDKDANYYVDTITCDADWLLGNGSIIEKNKELYGVNALNRNNVSNYRVTSAVLSRFSTDAEKDSVARFQAIYQSIVAYRTPETATDEQKNLVKHLLDNDLLALKKPQFVVFPNKDHSHYLAFPRAKKNATPEEITAICPQPQEVFFNIPNEMGHGVIIARGGDNLPDNVLNNPRNVRVQYGVVRQENAEVIMPLRQMESESGFVVTGAESVLRNTDGTPLYTLTTAMYDAANPSTRHEVLEVPNSGCFIALTGEWLRTVSVGEYDFVLTMEVPEHLKENSCEIRYAYFKLIVTPDILKWNPTVSNWNADQSWDAFDHTEYHYVPLPTTQVIMPAEAKIVPKPTAEPAVSQKTAVETNAQEYITYDIYGDTNDDEDFYYRPYSCSDIYFPVGASLKNQTTLNIGGKAFIDMPFVQSKWTMTSFPIHGVVSGDIFVSQSENTDPKNPFSVAPINQESRNVQDRVDHRFYQNLYNASVMNAIGSGSCQEQVQSSTWLTNADYSGDPNHVSGHTANGLAIPYGYAERNQNAAAFYLMNGGDATLRLPKAPDVTYKYFDKNTQDWSYLSDVITRSGDANYAKPLYTDSTGQTFTLRGNSASDIFLFGNPTFAYIDMAKFIAEEHNAAALTGDYYVLTGDKYVANLHGGANGDKNYYLPPYSAVLIKKAGVEKTTTLNVVVSDAMLTASVPAAQSAAPGRQSSVLNPQSSTIFISATSGGFTTYAMAEESAAASNDYNESEDADVFLMAPAQTPFVIYTAANQHAMAINRHNSLSYLPLSLYSQQEGVADIVTATITFSGDDSYLGDWELQLLGTNKAAPLKNGLSVRLSWHTDGTPTAALVRKRWGISTAIPDGQTEEVQVYTANGNIICGADHDMHVIEIYSLSGQLLHTASNCSYYFEKSFAPGIYLVRVDSKVYKVYND